MNSIVTMRRAALGATLLCGGLVAVSALAGSDARTVPTRVAVEYGDLDLSQPEAAEILYRRITAAARRACDEPGRADLQRMRHFKQCYYMAVTNAVDKVDAQTLTAVHRTRTQRSTPG